MSQLARTWTLPLLYVVLLLCIQSSVTCDEMKKFVAVWDNRFLEQVKLCSERIPGKSEHYFPKIWLLKITMSTVIVLLNSGTEGTHNLLQGNWHQQCFRYSRREVLVEIRPKAFQILCCHVPSAVQLCTLNTFPQGTERDFLKTPFGYACWSLKTN